MRPSATTPPLDGAVVAAERLAKRLGGRPVIDGVSLDVRRGEAVALIGQNGAGKSTLLRMLVRLIEPDAGQLQVLGVDLRAADGTRLRDLRRRIGMVFQHHHLVGRASVLTNVVHGALGRSPWIRTVSHRVAPPALRDEAMACLARVGLAHLAAQRADSLSGGQSQRTAIARALMQRPELLLADEPAASLDPAAGAEVMRVFADLVARDGLTLIFTSHQLDHARSHAHRILGLRGGRIVVDAAPAALSRETTEALYA